MVICGVGQRFFATLLEAEFELPAGAQGAGTERVHFDSESGGQGFASGGPGFAGSEVIMFDEVAGRGRQGSDAGFETGGIGLVLFFIRGGNVRGDLGYGVVATFGKASFAQDEPGDTTGKDIDIFNQRAVGDPFGDAIEGFVGPFIGLPAGFIGEVLQQFAAQDLESQPGLFTIRIEMAEQGVEGLLVQAPSLAHARPDLPQTSSITGSRRNVQRQSPVRV